MPDVGPAADVRGREHPACAPHPDIRVLGRSDDDLANAAQPFGVYRDADRDGRGAAAERRCLGRGPGSTADVVGGIAIVADAEERAITTTVVVAPNNSPRRSASHPIWVSAALAALRQAALGRAPSAPRSR